MTTNPMPGERAPEPGETCSCGRPAIVVYVTARHGDVPYCGIPDGGGRPDPFAEDTPDPDVQTVMRELRGLAERTADRHGENAAKALVRVFMAFLRDQIGERETLTLGRAAARGQWQGVVARLVKLGAWEQPDGGR